MARRPGHRAGTGVAGLLSGVRGVGVMLTSMVFVSFAAWSSAAPSAGLTERQDDFHWVDTWTSMPQLVEPNNMPPSPFGVSYLAALPATGSSLLPDYPVPRSDRLCVSRM